MKVYTDGSWNGVTKEGAWAYVMLHENGIIKKCGSKKNTTINAMELEAVCETLKDCSILGVGNIEIITDSSYVVNAIRRGYIYEWERNRWKTKKGRRIKNGGSWKELYKLLQGIDVRFVKVKGHSGDTYNVMVDHLAREAIRDNNVCSGKDSK